MAQKNKIYQALDTQTLSMWGVVFFTGSYQFPVLLQALIAVEHVVNPASVALQWDLPPFLTAGGTLALTGRKHQVLLPPVLVLHHSDRHTSIDVV